MLYRSYKSLEAILCTGLVLTATIIRGPILFYRASNQHTYWSGGGGDGSGGGGDGSDGNDGRDGDGDGRWRRW